MTEDIKHVRMSSCNECGSGLIGTENFCPYCGSSILPDDSQDAIAIDSALPVRGSNQS
jgi:RNA polymerase subunit RPABC4/transcription elongation factor Spt4